jgi:peroxiredoxin
MKTKTNEKEGRSKGILWTFTIVEYNDLKWKERIPGHRSFPGITKNAKWCFLFLFFLFLAIPCLANQLEYGSKINPVTISDTSGKKTSIPEKSKVNVLIFLNVNSPTHHRTLSEFNFLFINMIEEKLPVHFVGISRGIPEKFKDIKKRYNLKLTLINDQKKSFLSFFSYACGSCMKVVILDKDGVVRYNASYIDLNFVTRVIERYTNK